MRTITKPWGKEEIWAETDKYVGKLLYINKGHRLSRQYHVKKDETFYVQKGKMILEIGDPMVDNMQMIPMKKGDSFHCPPNTVHRMIATTDVKVFEVSTPELDDVVRLDDVYGRNDKK